MKYKHTYISICFLCFFLFFFSINISFKLFNSSKFSVSYSLKKEVKQSYSKSNSQNFIYLEDTKDEKNSTYHYLTLRAFNVLKKTNTVITSSYFNLFSHSKKSTPIIIKCHSLRI
jgi:hypothetical protein